MPGVVYAGFQVVPSGLQVVRSGDHPNQVLSMQFQSGAKWFSFMLRCVQCVPSNLAAVASYNV